MYKNTIHEEINKWILIVERFMDNPIKKSDMDTYMGACTESVMYLLDIQRKYRLTNDTMKLMLKLYHAVTKFLLMVANSSMTCEGRINVLNDEDVIKMNPYQVFKYLYGHDYLDIADHPVKYNEELHDGFIRDNELFIPKNVIERRVNQFYRGLTSYTYQSIIEFLAFMNVLKVHRSKGRRYYTHHIKMRGRDDISNKRWVVIYINKLTE